MKNLESMVGSHLINLFFPTVHVVMVHQSLPSFESTSSHIPRKPFLRTSAPQIDSLKDHHQLVLQLHKQCA